MVAVVFSATSIGDGCHHYTATPSVIFQAAHMLAGCNQFHIILQMLWFTPDCFQQSFELLQSNQD
jgi:hypothetical protein